MIKYTVPFVNSIRNRDFFLFAFSQYAEGPAFIIFTDESCPGTCGTDRTYERVEIGQYRACFASGGPPPAGSTAVITCQGVGEIHLLFESNEFLGVNLNCSPSEDNEWEMTISFDSRVTQDCVVTSFVFEGEDFCQAPCV